jgi:hypothetical protein
MHKLLRKPSPAMIIACVALFLATTGTGVAVISALPKGSVGAKQLKKNAVISSKIKNNAVVSSKIKNNAVVSSKIKDGSLQAADFASGVLPAAAAAKNVVKRTAKGDFGTVFSKATASCNSGELATGGGADWDASTSDGWPVVAYSVPNPYNATATPTGWSVEVDNMAGSGGVQAIAWVLCTTP